jgi:hypothetical protein
MNPIIPNIIFKSALWLRQNDMDLEAKYIVQYYTLNDDQKIIFDMINQKPTYGTYEGKGEGKHG